MSNYRRKTPQEILAAIQELKRGQFKIYIGAMAGAGKTNRLIAEGLTLKEQGVDVIVYAPHVSTALETILEINIEEIVRRNPEVVLIDELAETSDRFSQVQELLKNGISVIATINAYELNPVKEMAEQLVGLNIPIGLPKEILEIADEAVLIDMTTSHAHHKEEVGVLRELALRLMTETTKNAFRKIHTAQGINQPDSTQERILVAVQFHRNGSIYLRRGQQMAKRLNAHLHAVHFSIDNHVTLNEEEISFKTGMLKMIEKVQAKYEEIRISSKRKLAKALVEYGKTNHISRILLGHSKQTWWQEKWQGSIVNHLLHRGCHMDLFFVCDKQKRMIPALTQSQQGFHRLSEADLKERIEHLTEGTLKIYVGAAPGVGKTYAMLGEGNELLIKGIDVVIGLLETHGREETFQQIKNLEFVPRKKIAYRGTTLEEMDLEAIIKRNPEVVLVDELAHTNVPYSMHEKRYQDIQYLVKKGISVITTVNIQHIESLNDQVLTWTKVKVNETVPDVILHQADQVELIDLSPEALQKRLRQGKIYGMHKVEQALSNFFQVSHLIALREMALREVADEVDERLESFSLRDDWRKKEQIFVAVSSSQNAERLIRRGFRIAHRLKAPFSVHYVRIGEADHMRVEALRAFARALGGELFVHQATSKKEVIQILLEQADLEQSTQMIIGQSENQLLVKRMLRKSRHRDVLVVRQITAQ